MSERTAYDCDVCGKRDVIVGLRLEIDRNPDYGPGAYILCSDCWGNDIKSHEWLLRFLPRVVRLRFESAGPEPSLAEELLAAIEQKRVAKAKWRRFSGE